MGKKLRQIGKRLSQIAKSESWDQPLMKGDLKKYVED